VSWSFGGGLSMIFLWLIRVSPVRPRRRAHHGISKRRSGSTCVPRTQMRCAPRLREFTISNQGKRMQRCRIDEGQM
jgi:hypothetical protein